MSPAAAADIFQSAVPTGVSLNTARIHELTTKPRESLAPRLGCGPEGEPALRPLGLALLDSGDIGPPGNAA